MFFKLHCWLAFYCKVNLLYSAHVTHAFWFDVCPFGYRDNKNANRLIKQALYCKSFELQIDWCRVIPHLPNVCWICKCKLIRDQSHTCKSWRLPPQPQLVNHVCLLADCQIMLTVLCLICHSSWFQVAAAPRSEFALSGSKHHGQDRILRFHTTAGLAQEGEFKVEI